MFDTKKHSDRRRIFADFSYEIDIKMAMIDFFCFISVKLELNESSQASSSSGVRPRDENGH